ncbi:FtsK/SpoIIIE domain-containing protein, partial [Fictibacillus gelatini]|uniref:FtsK/SpoIIIE domain-containing protein n=1 Tax=Fictibacillus gelatini TaxID=225985 RepID=UPI000478EC19
SSFLFGSLAVYSHLKKTGGNSDAEKIQKIFLHCGLHGKNGETCQLYRKTKKKWGTEYAYRHPLGLCEEDFRRNIKRIEDGINIKKRMLNISFQDIKQIDLKQNPIRQIKGHLTKTTTRKSVEIEYDGMIRIKVYNKPMTDYLEYEEMKSDEWKVPIGVDRVGQMVFHNFEDEPHFLTAGATGGGKSSFLNMLIAHFIKTQADNVTFTLIDLKGGIEFDRFQNCRQVVNYAESPEEALQALGNVLNEMFRIRDQLKDKGFRNCKEGGRKQRHFVVIDEVAELSSGREPNKERKKVKESCEFYLSEIARLSRAFGIRLITATQHPTADVISPQVKRNSEGRLCFRVDDDVASRVVLDITGAESLPKIKGRAIYKIGSDVQMVQTPYISSSLIDEIIKPHIVIKPREEEVVHHEPTPRKNSPIIKKTRLSD